MHCSISFSDTADLNNVRVAEKAPERGLEFCSLDWPVHYSKIKVSEKIR